MKIKTKELERLIESILKEYITKDMVTLKHYLSLSDDEKKDYLPEEYPYFIVDFMRDNNIRIGQENNDLMDYEIVDWLRTNKPDVHKAYAEYLFSKIKYHKLDVPDSEYPAWSFFEKPRLIKNQWLIHFTNDAEQISREGFIYGVNELTKLGLTTHLSEFEKKYGGYNFAYTLNSFVKYATARRGVYKYGEEAVLFRASGIESWHYADEEPQVIFYGDTAKNIIPLTRSGSDWVITNKNNGEIILETDNLEKITNWITTNYDQYRNVL